MSSRDFLFKIYTEKKSHKIVYSIRAFARDLALPSGRVSEIFNGKRNLTEKLGLRIAEKLALSEAETAAFIECIRQDKKNKAEMVPNLSTTTVTITTDPAKIEVAKKKIAKFRESLTKYLESGPQNEVYTLNLQLLPVSKPS